MLCPFADILLLHRSWTWSLMLYKAFPLHPWGFAPSIDLEGGLPCGFYHHLKGLWIGSPVMLLFFSDPLLGQVCASSSFLFFAQVGFLLNENIIFPLFGHLRLILYNPNIVQYLQIYWYLTFRLLLCGISLLNFQSVSGRAFRPLRLLFPLLKLTVSWTVGPVPYHGTFYKSSGGF